MGKKKGNVTPLSALLLKVWIAVCAAHWGVDPSFALAVAHIESRLPGRVEFRCGPLPGGTFYGPFGIHRCFLKRWPIDNVLVNCWYGVRALRGGNKKKVLRRYNAEFDRAYWLAVRRAEEKYDEWDD